MLKQRTFRVVGGVLCALLVGCGGSQSVTNLTVQDQPRPPYSSLNLVLTDTTGAQTSNQLFLDPGTVQFPKTWPVVVGNNTDNEVVTLWRYDFIEPSVTDGSQWYATLLVRVDNPSSAILSFYGNGGTYQSNAYTLNPVDAFVGNVPETPDNKKQAAVFLFLRQGDPCVLVDPQSTGIASPYRGMGSNADVSVNIPGLDFPVGGVTLSTNDATPITCDVGNADVVTSIQATATTSSTSSSTATPPDPITTPITWVDNERISTVTTVSPVTSQWDLCYAWTPPALGTTLTHSFMVNPTAATGPWLTGEFGAVGGGFFLTMGPGAPDPTVGINTLNWTIMRTQTNPVWCLGWAADVRASGSIQAGQGGGLLNTMGQGQALVTGQVLGYLAGVMDPTALVTMFSGEQDKDLPEGPAVLFEGTMVPLVARSLRATIPGTLPQALVAGRTIWSIQNGTVLGGDIQTSDQELTQQLGITLGFSAYLPVLTTTP